MLRLLETGRALYVLVAVCLLGIVTRGITKHFYKGLVKESANLSLTKNKSLKELRQRAENTYRMNQGMRDTSSWLEHQLYDLHIMGISLQGWSNLCMQWTWICLLLGGAAAFASYWFRLDTFYIVLYGGGAVLMSMLTMLFDNGTNGGYREQLLVSLQDYMENIMCPRLARNLSSEALRSEGSGAGGLSEAGNLRRRKEKQKVSASVKPSAEPEQAKESPKETNADYLKRGLEQIAASREKKRIPDENWLKDLKPEEVELIGDILKQYLA